MWRSNHKSLKQRFGCESVRSRSNLSIGFLNSCQIRQTELFKLENVKKLKLKINEIKS